MSHFENMKKYLQEYEERDICYDSPFSEYIDDLYNEAVSNLSTRYKYLVVEPSIQAGDGGNFATFTYEGKGYEAYWDFATECEAITEHAMECQTEEELIKAIESYIEARLKNAKEVHDDESEEN